MKKIYYLTTTLPYVNADPHIGFALEIVQADVLARYHRLLGEEVIFNTGTDEHGLKIYQKALAEGKDPQAYCDEYAAKFNALQEALTLSYTNFIRTTDANHKAAAQEFWRLCEKNGDIYKKNYSVKYCVGCEMEKTDSELVDGKCPIHPKNELERIEEENYFFKFSKYQDKLLDLYKKRANFVVPSHRQEEITKFVQRGLEDFSISRLKSKMPWGVPVPGDESQVMYVWFDALINYISTLGWPTDQKNFAAAWPGHQVAGKDNLRQQSAMWQAMLLSAGIEPSNTIFIHGFITADGQKMSKSVGNVVNPMELVAAYGTDAVRYYLLGGLPSYEDGDYSKTKFEDYYTAHLANGVGNLTSRILTMAEKYAEAGLPGIAPDLFDVKDFWEDYETALRAYRFDEAVALIQGLVAKTDEIISLKKPWEMAKKGESIEQLLYQLVETLRHIALALLPIIPSAASTILQSLRVDTSKLEQLTTEQEWGRMPKGAILKKSEPLFPRLQKSQS